MAWKRPKSPIQHIDAEELRHLTVYNPETGIMTWTGKGRMQKAGAEIGHIDGHGYRVAMIRGKNYQVHRLAWLHVHGELPEEIDHVNMNRLDNRLENLRAADRQKNSFNKVAYSNNKLGIKGVHFSQNRFVSQIMVNGKRIHLGTYKTPEEARSAYIDAANKYFGEFCNVG